MGMRILHDCDDAVHRVHPLIPVSGTGTGFVPLPSRDGVLVGVVLFLVCLSVSVFSGLVSVLAGGYVWLDWVVRVQSVTWAGVSCSPLLPVSGTGTGFDPLPSRERGIGGCCLVVARVTLPSCGYCLEASMTVPGVHRFHPHL